MKVNSNSHRAQQQNFNGRLANSAAKFIAKHPVAIAGLAGSSVIAQKVVMSGSESIVGPAMDIAVGKGIYKATGKKDERINESSKTQAIRTHSQSIGGMITGIPIRAVSIAGATYLLGKAGEKAGTKLAELVNPKNLKASENLYEFKENAAAWGKTVGGAVAIFIMLFTNFLLDVPIVNHINKKITDFVKGKNPSEKTNKNGGAE